jgi:uncharacterized iron-regulated membrane protein
LSIVAGFTMPSAVRTALFWIHLVCGLTAGVVILIMSFTGAALALQPQILAWVERDQRQVAVPVDGVRLAPAEIVARVQSARPGATVAGITIERDPARAATVTLAPAATLYVNPYTGELTGIVQQTGVRKMFRSLTDWHRWLALQGASRDAGRWVTGTSNAAFLFLAISGMFLWIPRVWNWTAVAAVAFFRRGLSGKARDFNWHHVIGVWSAPVLVVLTFTAMCISFPKTYDVIYGVTGMERPPAAPRPDGQAAKPAPMPVPSGLDAMWATAVEHMPSWKSIALRLPQSAGQPVTFTINDLEKLNPMARSTLTMDAASGHVVKWDPYDQQPAGQRLRTWMRFGHTGEIWGVNGQIIAGLASAGGCVLVWTGMALALRRFMAWRSRRARRLSTAFKDEIAA